MCAFFAFEKGRNELKNKVFAKKTVLQKRQHLSSTLKYITGGALDDAMIGRIMHEVAIHEQYTVSMYPNYDAFNRAVSRAQAGRVRTSTVYSRNNAITVVAVITPLRSAKTRNSRRAIYILAPLHS